MASVKRVKMLVFLSIGFAIGAGGVLWNSSRTSYFISLPVTCSIDKLPVIDAMVGDDTQALHVRVGSRFPLALNRKILEKLDKQPHGVTTFYDQIGESREVPSYLIPKIKIGDLTVINITAVENSAGDFNVIGKFLGGDFNLFLDFPRSRIVACNSFSKLKAKGLVDERWIGVPFEITRAGVVLRVHTDLGMQRLAINTLSKYSGLKMSLISSGQPITSATFCIGKREFGNMVLNPIDVPSILTDIEGFIGMDFLKNHAIYLDYTNKVAYIEPLQVYFERFPVSFSDGNIPVINVRIENNIYPLELDLGMSFPFSLTPKVLQEIRTDSYSTAHWLDFKGNEYQSPIHTVPGLQIGNQIFLDARITQDTEDFYENTRIEGAFSEKFGRIGLPILEKYNLFLDFPHEAVYICDTLSRLQEPGLLSTHLLAIPFLFHKHGILLSVETKTGVLRLILDTGCTKTVVRHPYALSVSEFRIMGHDFGSRSICPIDLCSDFDFDGYLGMDFLMEHPLFIDYSNKIIYLDLQKAEN